MERFKKIVKKIPFVADTYRGVRDGLLANKKPVVTPFGFKFVGSREMQSGAFEPADVKVFQTLMQHVSTVIDVGAHAGYYCLQALQAKKHLIAFEPMPQNTKMLLKNIALNGFEDNAEVFQMALAARPGIAKMYGGGTGASLIEGWAGFSGKNPLLVPVSSFDAVLGDRLAGSNALILIDVEGFEFEVLKGAGTLLASDPKPIWMVEIVHEGYRPSEPMNKNFIPTFEFFWKHGYDAYLPTEEGIRPIRERDLRADIAAAIRGATSWNFIFIHRGNAKAREALLGVRV